MSQSTPILFNPPAEITSAILLALTDPAISFNQLAQVCDTSPDALALWLSRPDIRRTIESVDRATTWRTRLIASAHLHTIPHALAKILQDFTADREAKKVPSSEVSPSTSKPPAPAIDEVRHKLLAARHAETARKSAALLIGLSRTRPTAGPELAAAAPAEQATHAAPSPATLNASTESPAAPQQPGRLAPSLDELLCKLAPHLETIAAELGIDPNDPNAEPSPTPDPAPSEVQFREPNDIEHSSRNHKSRTPAAPAPSRPGKDHSNTTETTERRAPELVTAGAHEHWP